MIKLAKNLTLSAALAVGMLATGGIMLNGNHGVGSTPASASAARSAASKDAIAREPSKKGHSVSTRKRHKWGWGHWDWRHHKWTWGHRGDTTPKPNTKPPDEGPGKDPEK